METRSFAYTSNWMVLTTHAHREEFAIENLVRQEYEAYCPMIVKRIKHARRAYDVKRPPFPGYVFVERPAERHLWRLCSALSEYARLFATGRHRPCSLPVSLKA